ncbi:MAG: aldehyde dehydrogenase family protein [Comamonadaceae bacterium]|nr:aldehyde dehydrogenase family protein [Comamonadaceae bacterium]
MDGRLIIANERVETPEKLVSENPATLAPVGEVSAGLEGALRPGHRGGQGGLPGLALARSPGEAGHLQAGRERPGPAGRRGRAAHRPGEGLALSRIPGGRGLRRPPVAQLLRPTTRAGCSRPKRAGHHTPLFLNKSGDLPLPSARPDPHHLALELPLPHPHVCDTLSALTAGNTVVLRPSTATPVRGALSSARSSLEAGLPPGVLNVVVCTTSPRPRP